MKAKEDVARSRGVWNVDAMDPEEIPPDVLAFIQANIPSVGHIEALQLILEEHTRAWSAPEVAKRLYVSEEECRGLLCDLHAAGLLQSAENGARWRFGPVDPELADRAARTVQFYQRRLVVVTRLIHARVDAGKQFSDAFRFRRRD